jgi:hypothetical protein
LLGKVAHLKQEQGSYFTVQTPVGAAGIRGTTFRIVFRPTGTGQAFAFSLSTVEGNVNFQAGQANGAAQGGTPQGGPTQGQPGTPTPGTEANGGVPVVTGQEVVVTVSVDVNQQTGQVTVTAPPTVTSTQPISVETQAALVQQAQTLATTAASTSFTPTSPANGAGNAAPNSGNGEKQQDDQSKDKQSDSNESGGGAGGPSSSGTPSTGGNSNQQQTANPLQSSMSGGFGPASPGATSNLPDLTPGAGKGAQ